jgi:hypothetical protein
MTSLNFSDIFNFISFCKEQKINPIINLIPKKHQNMRGEHFHELFGNLTFNSTIFEYTISGYFITKEKFKFKEEGYLITELITF